MTSPDESVPPGTYSGATGAGRSIANLQKLTWDSARAAIVADVMTSFQQFASAGGNLTTTSQQAMSTASGAQSVVVSAAATAQDTQTAATANAAVVAGLTATRTGATTGGTAFSDTFARTTIGAGYTTFTTGQVAGLVVSGGQVQLDHTGDQDSGTVVALSTTILQTDDQSVSIVLGDANQAANVNAGIYLRAAVDLSTFVFAGIGSRSVVLGYGSRSGGTTTYHTWTSATATVNTGDLATVQAMGDNYEVLVNGVPVLGYADSAVVSPVGSANRSFGFDGEYNWTGLFGYFPFAVAGLSAADLSSPAVTGVGWGLARISSTGATQPTGESRLGTATFDTLRQSGGVTVSALGAGQVAVRKSGWYLIEIGLTFSGQDSQIRAGLWLSTDSGVTWSLLRSGARTNLLETDPSSGSDYGYTDNATAAFVVYLSADSIVAPGCSIHFANSIVGPNTYFDGALLNS